jgi:glycosyltransferase involved in cell wall biosynthesis
LAASRALAKWLQRSPVDVLHTHNPSPHAAGALARLRTQIPVLVHTKHGRNYPGEWRRVLVNRGVSWLTDCVVAVSHDAASVSREIERIPERKLRVIHNGIDLTRFAPVKGVPNPRRAIHVARIADPPKDHTTLLRAVRRVADVVPDFHLEIVGDGPQRGAVEQLCDELRLRDNVTLMGFRSDVAERIGQCGLAMLSSLTEGLSITLLEAMAMGLPVVATDVGGNREVVAQGKTGILVPAEQPEAMAEAMLTLIRSPEQAAAMGAAGRERMEDGFNLSKVAEEYSELYLELLGKRKYRSANHGARVSAPA